jgi:uncharacterized protein with HEPN domain
MRYDRFLLQDILDAIAEVIDTTPATRDADKFLRAHLLRHIQIIGEAAWRLSGTLKERNPQVP